VIANDRAAGEYFGWSVDISGDTAVVGAPYGDDENGSYSGCAYIFYRNGSDWFQTAKLIAYDGTAGYFGWSVAISGDTAVVGAFGGGSNRGSAYVFDRQGSAWSWTANLVANDGVAFDYFGCSVSVSGDTAVVGAYGDGGFSGSAYIFDRNDIEWVQMAKLVANDGVAGDYFGQSVAISGDIATVGAP